MTLVNEALGYAAQGWSVIPVQPGTKNPLVPWTEFHERRATEAEIRTWWQRSPRAGIGIVTGRVSGLVVVDIDKKHGLDIKEVLAADPCNFIVETGTGGYHLYYRYPEGVGSIENQVNNKGRDVRADGGFVVAPPTIHASGKPYQWVRGEQESPLTAAPAFVRNGRHENGNGNGTAPKQGQDHWISETLKGVSAGGRNDAATRLAGYYVSRKMAPDVVLNLLLDWNQKNSPPLAEADLRVIVDSVQRTAERRGRQIPGSSSGETFGLLRLSEYMTKYGAEEIEWLIEDWMPHRTIAMAVAPPGSYKTWLELDLAVAVAMGVPFLGTFPVGRTGPVIIVQQEDFHGQMAERMGTIIESHSQMGAVSNGDGFTFTPPPDPPIYLHPDRRLRFRDNTVMQALEEKIAAIKPVLVIIDPLYSTGETDDYMASTVAEMFALKEMRDKYGCSFFFAHHTKKASAEGSAREDSWGSQFLNAFIETGWQVRPKDKPGQVVIRRHFKVRPNIEEALLTFDIQTDKLPYHYSAHLKTIKLGEMTMEGPGIKEALAEKPMTLSELARHCGISKSTVAKRLATLHKAGDVVKDLHGLWALSGESVV